MITLTNGAQVPENAVQLQTAAAIDGYCVTQTLRLVQYDETLPVAAVQLTIRNQPYTPPAGAGLNVRMSKPDGTTVYNPCLGMDSSGIVYFAFTQQMTIAAGYGTLTVEITDSGVKNSAPIIVDIKRNPVPEGSVESSDEFLTLQELLAKVEKLAAQAESSAAAAKTSETNAAGSASTASAKADDAGESASAAAASAVAAKTSETNAKASETAAKTSETNAKASETAAASSASVAASSASAAKTSASAAASSETNAANSKTAAADSASAAAGSASAAENSASAAAGSASAAENSASAAADSQKVAEEKAAQATNAAGTAVAAAGTAAADAAAQAAAKTEQQIRQYADDRYARPLVTKTGPATSLEVYPDKQSNMKVYANGFTKQAGSGDPSPTNARALTNGGINMVELVLTGSESGRMYAGLFYLDGFKGIAAKDTDSGYCNSFAYKTYYPGKIGVNSVGDSVIYAPNDDYSADSNGLNAFKAMLAARYAAGNPVKVWYVPVDESQATGLYAPIILQGGEYRATCLPLTAPLRDGDSVVSWARSGCDKFTIFDGSEDEEWSPFYGAAGIFYIDLPNAEKMSNTLPVITDRLYYVSRGDSYTETTYGDFSTQYMPGVVRFIIRADDSSTDPRVCRTYIAAHPLTVWYRSTNYTAAADIAVSLETHQRAYKEYAVADMNNAESAPGWKDSTLIGILGAGVNTAVSGAKSSVTPFVYANTRSGSALYLRSAELGGLTQSQTKEKYPDMIVQVTLPYKTPITYAHPAVELPALPDDTGKVTITGQRDGTVTAVFNKSIIKEIAEIKAAMLAMGANLSM